MSILEDLMAVMGLNDENSSLGGIGGTEGHYLLATSSAIPHGFLVADDHVNGILQKISLSH